jgi:hypothetical protein
VEPRLADAWFRLCWTGMKDLLRRVVPMLRCCRVLVPLKMVVNYEDVLISLEQTVGRPELIAYQSLSGSSTSQDARGAIL